MTGRKKEIKILNQLLRKNESSLVAVYGRRRIGKTYLIREVYKSNKDTCLYFEFTGSYDKSKDVQITNFLTSINVWFAQETEKEIKTWSQAFSFFTSVMIKKIKECPDKKIILFFDEMPWIDKSTKGGFPSALGHFWNSFIEHYKNFVVVLCGSNAAWIKKKLLNENVASFNHRFNETIPLKPFDLEETKEYLLNELKYNVDDKTIVELYMIFGGVAKYLSYIKNDKTLEDNISRIFFSSESLMFEEYNNLFQSLFGSDEKEYKSIMNLLSSKKSGFNTTQILKHLNSNSVSQTTILLNNLQQCGFIKSIATLGNKGEYLYIVSDPYCLFYHDWIKGMSKNKIMNLPENYWQKQTKNKKYSSWGGFAFEMATIINIHLYTDVRGRSGVFKSVYSWNYKPKSNSDETGAQIDIIVEYDNNNFDLVECKHWSDEYTITATEKKKIKNKKDMFIKYKIGKNEGYSINTIMFTSYGTKINPNYTELNIVEDIKLSDLI